MDNLVGHLLSFRFCRYMLAVLLFHCVPFPIGGLGRDWNLTASVPIHCRFIYFEER